MNVMTKKNQDHIEGTQVPIKSAGPDKPKHLVPAPIAPITISIAKSATEVVLPVTLYLESGFPPLSLSYCLERITNEELDNGTIKESRTIHIAYNYDTKEDQYYVPQVYNLILSNLDLNMEEMEVTLFLTNIDPETSRGTSTTVKREM